jgi:hypothetical protein
MTPLDFGPKSIATKEHIAVEVHSCAAATGNYGIPMDMRPEPTSQVTRLHFSSGGQKEIVAEDCLTWNDDFRVAVVAQPDPEPFEIMATMQTGKAKRLKNPDRIRDAVKDANEQFENGLKYKDGPCLLMIFHDGLDVPDITISKSALYGNLKFVLPKGKPEAGALQLDDHGAFNPDRRRETSAVLFVRNGGAPIIIHNHWALREFPRGLFGCKEITALNDGTFQEIDYSRWLWVWLKTKVAAAVKFVAVRFRRPAAGSGRRVA